MDTLDVKGLPDDQIDFLQQLIEFMREKHQQSPTLHQDKTQTVHLCSWPRGVKGAISREEIYRLSYRPRR
jgi:hypothetical protein